MTNSALPNKTHSFFIFKKMHGRVKVKTDVQKAAEKKERRVKQVAQFSHMRSEIDALVEQLKLEPTAEIENELLNKVKDQIKSKLKLKKKKDTAPVRHATRLDHFLASSANGMVLKSNAARRHAKVDIVTCR